MLAKAILYPRCIVKKRIGLFLAPFFEELFVIAPSESGAEKIALYSKDIPVDVKPLVPSPLGEDSEKFDSNIKALEIWAQQMGLGESGNFESFYSALANAPDQEVKEVMKAIKGEEDNEIKMATRIFLALSIDADIREDELEEEMELIEKKTKRLTQLVNDEESILEEKEAASKFVAPINRAKERLCAWAQFAFEEGDFIGDIWPVGESVVIKDHIDVAFEGLKKRSSNQIFEIVLPSKEFIKNNQDIFEKTRPIFKQILSRLDSKFNQDVLSEVIKLKDELQEYLLKGSKKQRGEAKLVLSYYEDTSLQSIINSACKLTEINKYILQTSYSFFVI